MKCFLSHSSKDKDNYVEIVAKKLGSQNIIYDRYTFEVGMPALEEILRRLDQTQLFVIFLSNASLSSKWVKEELTEAKQRFDTEQIDRIYPIIIDRNITYLDTRIPSWMRDEYNLKLVTRPTVAVRKIRQRLRELSWKFYPKLQEKNRIFVGRNEQMMEFEERIDDFDMPKPICVTATGLRKIGKRTFLRHALVKTNFIDESYTPPVISLSQYDSIEDFILKLNDLGISQPHDLTYLSDKSLDTKIELAVDILNDINKAKEMILILDNGCLVNYKRDFEDWFRKIILELSNKESLVIATASAWRPYFSNIKNSPYIFVINLPELTVNERKGLLKRYIELEDINLTKDDFSFFSGLLYGFPDQINYTVSLIKDLGVIDAKKSSYLIQQYNNENASVIMQTYTDDDSLDFIYLLSQFEIISLDFLFEIADEEKFKTLLQDLLARSIVDTVGVEQEFIRLNDTIRDYISRNRFGIPAQFREKLKRHVEFFLKDSEKFDRDISDFQFSVKQALLENKDISSKFIIPSHFLKTMRELYEQRKNYDRVIELAKIILQKKEFLNTTIRDSIQYYLCLALARKKDRRFLSEVQNIHGPEHNFLLGFYYRLMKRDDDALTELNKALDNRFTAIRARREIVQVYLSLEQYDRALEYAKANYEDNRENPYHIQAYFNCIINQKANFSDTDNEIAKKLIEELKNIGSKKSLEMSQTAYAWWLAKCENEYRRSIETIEDAIYTFPKSPYPIIAKFNIQLMFLDIEGMEQTIAQMKISAKKKIVYDDAFWRAKCLYLAVIGQSQEAIKTVKNHLKSWPYSAQTRLIHKIEQLSSNT